MAIKIYLDFDRKLYEVYVNGFDGRGKRLQRRKRGIESLRKAESIEFEFKHELAKLKESDSKAFTWAEGAYQRSKVPKLSVLVPALN